MGNCQSKPLLYNKYSEGKIYKIVCRITGDVYIGSTIQPLNARMCEHRRDAKALTVICQSKLIMDRGDYYIELIELYPCNSQSELL